MKRRFRWLLNGLALLSLLVCLALAVLWVRSYTTKDRLDFTIMHESRLVWIESNSGQFCITMLGPLSGEDSMWLDVARSTPVYEHQPSSTRDEHAAIDRVYAAGNTFLNRWGFRWWSASRSSLPGLDSEHPLVIPPLHSVGVPFWLLMILTAIMPARWIRRAVARRRVSRRGLCPGCGYDLRANPDRCPECGTIAAAKA